MFTRLTPNKMFYARIVIWSLVWKFASLQGGLLKCHNDVTILNPADYTIISDMRTWSAASDYCRSVGKELAVMDTNEEFEFVQQMLQDQAAIDEDYWLGASDLETEGSFKWLDGRDLPMGSTMWAPREPNNAGGNENCVHAYGYHGFLLNNRECSSPSRSICEIYSCPAKTFSITKGYRLLGNVLEKMEVFTLTQCCGACMSHLSCTSVNFDLSGAGTKDTRVRKMCELNGYSKAGNEDSFVLSEGFMYAEVDM